MGLCILSRWMIPDFLLSLHNSWYAGIVFFFLGNCLNFISFGYAAQVCFLQFDWNFMFNDLWCNFMIICSSFAVFFLFGWYIFSEVCYFLWLIWWMYFHLFWLLIFLCAVQSLLAALGSVQFVSNIAFAYFVLNKMVTVKYAKFELRLLFHICLFSLTLF